MSATETSFARARRAYHRSVARFISPSEFLAEQMRHGGWDVPIEVIPNAVPVEPPREGWGEGFVCSGRVAHEKGVEIAIQAARSAGVALTVAGIGPEKERLQALYPDVPFTGHLNRRQVLDLVCASRAVVVPSIWLENAPLSVLEPMAAGVPVIASRIGGIPEQMTDGVEGLLVEPGDVAGLAAAMKRLAGDPTLAADLGAHARQTVADRFSPEVHLRSLVSTYEACLRS